jgi:hypothetical protein
MEKQTFLEQEGRTVMYTSKDRKSKQANPDD